MHSIFCFPYCIVGAVYSQRASPEQISPATRIRSLYGGSLYFIFMPQFSGMVASVKPKHHTAYTTVPQNGPAMAEIHIFGNRPPCT